MEDHKAGSGLWIWDGDGSSVDPPSSDAPITWIRAQDWRPPATDLPAEQRLPPRREQEDDQVLDSKHVQSIFYSMGNEEVYILLTAHTVLRRKSV